MVMKQILRYRTCESGAVAIEFAFVGFLMVLVSIGVIEIGRGLNVRSQLSFAVDSGARMILIDSSASNSQLDGTVRAAFAGSKPELLQVDIGQETVNAVDFRLITVQYPFNPLIPKITKKVINIRINRRIPLLTN